MKNITIALFAAVALLIPGGAAQATGTVWQSSAVVAASAAETGMLIESLEVVNIPAPLRPDVRPVTLAQLEDQLRRPELQASLNKGSIAVVYPNVEEPFRSAFLAMIQGIEDRIKFKVRATRSIRASTRPN
jgi:putative ABC transport system substrate-binding protein